MTDAEIEDINNQASVLMKRGIAFLEEPRREAAIDALHCFDEALELRRRVPADHSPFQGYLLAACLLNRADALARMNDAGPLAAALATFDEAIAVLERLPLAEDPRYPRRLALGYQNRALALQARGKEGDLELAARSFADALAVLDQRHSETIEDRRHMRAVVCLNLANLRTAQSPPDVAAARASAAQALDAVSDLESDDPNAAALGLQARHMLCRACAHFLSQASDDARMPDDVHEATDAVDDGLAIVRRWEQRGFPYFRPLALDLFRFGARVYARFQPQFLDEFIDDNLDPGSSSPEYVQSPEMVMAAEEARQLLPRGTA